MPDTQAKLSRYRDNVKGFTKVPNYLIYHATNGKLKPSHLAVLVAVLSFFYGDRQVRIQVKHLARVVGLKERRVRDILKALDNNEVVRLKRTGEIDDGQAWTFEDPRQENAGDTPAEECLGSNTPRQRNARVPGRKTPGGLHKTSVRSLKTTMPSQDDTGASIAAPKGEDKECAIPFSDPGTILPGFPVPAEDDPNYCPF